MQRRDFIAASGILAAFGPRVLLAAVDDPLPAEGVQITYRVLFGDSEIGTQSVAIREHDMAGHVVVEHETKLEVRIFFATAYALEHHSTEIWEGFSLKSVRSRTILNGEESLVEGVAAEEGFRVQAEEGEWVVPAGAVTSDSFWLAAAMKAPTVVNTRTGDMASPEIARLEDGRWHLKADFEHGPVEATVRFDGDFLVEADVDSGGHRVKLERINA